MLPRVVCHVAESTKVQRRFRRQLAAERLRELPSCVSCRKKRRKCDNRIPTCGHCMRNEQECLYPYTLLGIARLGLDGKRRGRRASPGDRSDEQAIQENSVFNLVSVRDDPACVASCEAILQWSLLSDINVEGPISSFPSEVRAMQTVAQPTCQQPKPSSNCILFLCRVFLGDINSRNPVVDASQLTQYAYEANEHGPGWDGPGCLVLFACALASSSCTCNSPTARDFTEGYFVDICGNVPLQMRREAEAENFYIEAQQRLESLPNSLVTIQCTYLAGLYEQYFMRPLDAWRRFLRACVSFQNLPHFGTSFQNDVNCGDQRDKSIRQCLYWSCIKAEFELRAELKIRSSDLLGLFKKFHPKLASTMAWMNNAVTPEFLNSFGSDQNPSTRSYRNTDYYEDDLLLRGTMNHIINDVYGQDEITWISELPSLMKCAKYSEIVETWREWPNPFLEFPHPLSKSSPAPEVADNAQSFLLQVNHLCIVELLHRPFIYCVLARGSCIELVDHPLLVPLAQQYISISCALIKLVAGAYFRYEGTWTLVRRSFGCSLVLIAAVRYNYCHRDSSIDPLQVPEKWREIVEISIETIWKWERPGVEDLSWMRRIWEHMSEVIEK